MSGFSEWLADVKDVHASEALAVGLPTKRVESEVCAHTWACAYHLATSGPTDDKAVRFNRRSVC